jgi:hypothetical protein
MAGLLFLDKLQSSNPVTFIPPHPKLDALNCSVTHLAENVRAARDYFTRTGLPSQRGDVVTVTSLAPINTLVTHTHIMNLSDALQTQFAKKLDIPDGESSQETAARINRRPDNDTFLLTQSNLDFLGMNMDYLESQGDDNAFYTVHGSIAHMPLNATKLRHISTVFTWPEDVLLRINQHIWAVWNLACDVTIFPDLDPTLYAFHLFQHFEILLANRVQGHKLALLNASTNLGYTPISTADHILSLLKDIRAHAYISAIISDQPITKVDTLFLAQAIDGLQRSAHLQPDHIRGLFNKSLQALANRIKSGAPVRASALLLNIGALLQSQPRPAPPPEQAAMAAFATEPIPDFRRSTDDRVSTPAAESAMLARFDDRLQGRPDRARPDPRSDGRDLRPLARPVSRQDLRPDYPSDRGSARYNGRYDAPRGDSRPASRFDDYRASRSSDDRYRDSDSSDPRHPVTLADIQKSFTTIQSQLDKHSRQAAKTASPRRDRASPPRRDRASPPRSDRAAHAAHFADTDEIAYTTVMEDDDAFDPAFHVRQTWASHPQPLQPPPPW